MVGSHGPIGLGRKGPARSTRVAGPGALCSPPRAGIDTGRGTGRVIDPGLGMECDMGAAVGRGSTISRLCVRTRACLQCLGPGARAKACTLVRPVF